MLQRSLSVSAGDHCFVGGTGRVNVNWCLLLQAPASFPSCCGGRPDMTHQTDSQFVSILHWVRCRKPERVWADVWIWFWSLKQGLCTWTLPAATVNNSWPKLNPARRKNVAACFCMKFRSCTHTFTVTALIQWSICSIYVSLSYAACCNKPITHFFLHMEGGAGICSC